MEKEKREIEKIDNAILKMKESYSKYDIYSLIIKYLVSNDLTDEEKKLIDKYFTNIDKETFINEIAKHSLKVAGSNDKNISYKHVSNKFLNELIEYKVAREDIIKFLQKDNVSLMFLIVAFIEQRYYSNMDLEEIEKVENQCAKNYLYYLEPTNSNNPVISNLGKVRNLLFNKNRCDLLNNRQIKQNHVDYSLGKELFATMDIGNVKENQEDGSLIVEHPNNKKFKLLAVADGISYSFSGEKASNYALASVLKWFENLDESYYDDLESLETLLINKLKQINVELRDNKDGRGTTFTCAIVGNDKTLISSIGDSRAYLLNNEKLTRLTKDDSYIQKLNELSNIGEDKLRFHKSADIVNKYLGMIEVNETIAPQTYLLNNDEYDILLLVTDGITRCLNDDKIEYISKITLPSDITKKLVLSSKNSLSKMKDLYYGFNEEIKGGIDNTTAVVYSKKR